MKRLWEIDHAYYCNEGNYYAPGNDQPVARYSRWQDFIDEQGDADLDMNLLFRFDFIPPRNDEEEIVFVGDENYRDCTLKLFYIGQRKGLYRWVTVDVCRADEPMVREWLKKRWDHMKELWSPFE